MPFPRTRYIAFCQQFLVTASVLAVGVTAAGVKTLEIVPTPTPLSADGVRNAVKYEKSTVDVAPVTPEVKEVAVTGMNREPLAGSGAAPTGSAAGQPGTAQRQAPTQQDQQDQQTQQAPTAGTLVHGLRLAAETTPQAVAGYATIGVTWAHGVELPENGIAVEARTLEDGAWSGWTQLAYHDEHGPDSDTSEGRSAKDRPGTDALVIGDADEVQMRAGTTTGQAPADLRLAVIDPGTGRTTSEKPAIDTSKLPSAQHAGSGESATLSSASTSASTEGVSSESAGLSDRVASLAAMTVAPKPQIFSRAQWGANESLRDKGSLRYGTIQTGFIHHTVNANNYTEAQVPSLLRGIYAYHTQSRGWSDIGYNFLVDRFGHIWEGRAGGVDKAVVGAHTLGYNEVSFAMSAIGNFQTAQPPQAVLDAYAQLFAWKLSMYNIRADASGLTVKGTRLNAINGHRDVGQTECPGIYLYNKIPSIRAAAQAIQNRAQSGAPAPAPTPTPTPTPAPAQKQMTSPTQTPDPASAQPSISFPRASTLTGGSWPDLAVKAANGDIRVLRTAGQLGFGAPVTTVGKFWRAGIAQPIGDVTGDGISDVLLRQGGRKATIMRGTTSGRLAPAKMRSTKAFARVSQLTSGGDWNRDGRSDVLGKDARTGQLLLFPRVSGNRWGAPRALGDFSSIRSFAVPGDLTGDGVLDLVALGYDGTLSIYPGSGGRLGAPIGRRSMPGADTVVGSGDLTGDGVADVLVRTGDNGAILAGNGHGGFGDQLGPFPGLGGIRTLGMRQLAGSSQADVTGIRNGRFVVVPHNGRSNVLPVLGGNLSAPAATQVLAVGDWNRDGKGDVITREGGGDTLVLHPGQGNGSFGAAVTMIKGWAPVANLSAVGDVTGDGNPDLLGRTGGRTLIFPGNGGTGFLAPRLAPTSMRSFNQIGTGGWAAQSWTVASSLGGAGVPLSSATATALSGYDWVVGSGDVDGDGYADLIAREKGTGTLWLLPGTSSGLGTRRLIGSGYGGYTLAG